MYDYEKERPKIFTEVGMRSLLGIRDNVERLLNEAGAFKLWDAVKGHGSTSFIQLACIDYLVEIGEIEKVSSKGSTQNHVFVRKGDWA